MSDHPFSALLAGLPAALAAEPTTRARQPIPDRRTA